VSKIKLLIIIHSLDIGGSEGQVYELVKGLDKEKYEPTICSLSGQGPYVEKIRSEGVRVVTIGARLRHIPWNISKLLRLMRSERFDIVHNEMLTAAFIGTIVAKCFRVPVIINCVRGLGFVHYWYRRPLKRCLYKLTDCVVTNSKEIETFLVKLRIARNVRVIYNGVDLRKFHPTATSASLAKKKAELNIPQGAPIIGIIASLSPVKNHDCLLRAIPQVLDRFPNAMFLLIGSGPLRAYLEELASKFSIATNVRFLGPRADIDDLLKVMDFSILCSHREGVSNAILESLASAKPVIASNVGGNPESVIHGENGYLFESSNSEQLAQHVIEMLSSAERRTQLGLAARKTAEEKFSLEEMVALYERLYESLLQTKTLSGRALLRSAAPIQ